MAFKRILIKVKRKTLQFFDPEIRRFHEFKKTAVREAKALIRPIQVVRGIKIKRSKPVSQMILLKKNPFKPSNGGIL